MRLLLDTNIFLEVILEQERSDEVKSLLERIKEHQFLISDYSLHSIGLLLFQRKQHDVFSLFVKDMLLNARMVVTSLASEDMAAVVDAARRFSLDFDDAYQYATAEKFDLVLVSFDSDFDRTEHGRTTPDRVSS
ncbi:MAG: type II toxin-antitoxin system VapC family toxin [Bacteroidota bacterium]